ncbi:MAG: glucose 1-dehydrogenase [Firmicutes bacterium]|jgi:NAD(P)-dependent dehydrogenase (short-subunit alcohol dehydrogenase family)|nr:glucose 1-dehydrogenase [Bacillota bacterium]
MLDGKVAVVTGSSRGVGYGIAEELAAARATVVITGVDPSRAEKAASVIAETHKTPSAGYAVDVRERGQIEDLRAKIVDRFGRVDILVNNAGVETIGLVTELTDEDWDYVFDINMKGVFRCCQVFARQMIEQGQGGKIINISSVGGKLGFPYRSHYCASKAAVNCFSRVIAKELIPYGIAVNCICPGTVRTDLLDYVASWEAEQLGKTAEEVIQKWIEEIPLGRAIESREIGKVVVYLASDTTNAVIGQVINVDGGISPF